jgi:spore photoproduct lyase
VNTENTFFEGKRPWSKIKDSVLKDYLPPYFKKVATLGPQIILIDAFAGPGIFENEIGEDKLGSPLIILNTAERQIPGKYFAIFVNSNGLHHNKLETAIKKHISLGSAKAKHCTAQELIKELKGNLSNQTLFIYLDPFGLKNLDFGLIEPFLQRDISYSTEILINMSMPTLHRLATRKLQKNGKQTPRSIRLNETLTKVLGGDYWKEIMWNESLCPEDKEIKVIKKYRELLKKYLPYIGSCPVRERDDKRVKYFITICSRHPDAMYLMNDAMCKAYFKYMHEQEFSDTLFKDVDWKNMRPLSEIKKIILGEIESGPRQSRIELWYKIIQNHFMEFHSSEYKEAIKKLVKEEKIRIENPKDTGRLNDDCIIFLANKGNHNSTNTNRLLIKEKVLEYSRKENKPYNKLKICLGRYKTIDGRTKILVSQVNDGSIIVRFDKTPFPMRFTDVVCPHFIELKWAYGCPYDCSWCYLKGTFRFRPNGKEPVVKDYGKIELHTRAFLEEVKNPEILNTGEIADSLMHENSDKPFSKYIIPIFETQKIHKVMFLTKSSDVKNLLEIEPHNQAIISFSLNAIPVAKRWEKAPSILKRIEAARKVYKVGYEVRVRIDPMVPIDNWKESYKELVDLVFENLAPERITLGSLRGLQSTINGCSDRSWVKYLTESSNWGKKIDFDTRFNMYSEVIDYLKSKHNYKKVALCKETIKMWNGLKMNYKQIKCNCTF